MLDLIVTILFDLIIMPIVKAIVWLFCKIFSKHDND